MARQMSQETIKRKLIEQLRIRQENNRQLTYLMEQIEPDVNEYIGDSYPHERSFDELAYAENEWMEEFIENLERAHVLNTYHASFFNDPPILGEIEFTREIKAENLAEAKQKAFKIALETGTLYEMKESEEE